MNGRTSVASICLVAMLFTRTAYGADAGIENKLATARQLLENARDEIPATHLSSLQQRLTDAENAYSGVQRALRAACKDNSEIIPECAASNNIAPTEVGVGAVAVAVGAAEVTAMTALAFLAALTYSASVNKGEDALINLRNAQKILGMKIAALAAAAETALAELARAAPKGAAPRRGGDCYCICGDPSASITARKPIGRMPEFECKAACTLVHGFLENQYTCN